MTSPVQRCKNAKSSTAWLRLSLAIAGALLAAPCLADEPIATDRPDFVESSATVGQGRFQIETSVAWERDDQSGVRDEVFTTPTLLRYGVSQNWELRLETDGWMRQTLRDSFGRQRATGVADTSIGVKYHITRNGVGGASMAWLVNADVASGSKAFAGHGVRPSLRFVAEWELPSDLALGIMPGVIRDNDGNGRDFTAGIFGVVVGKALTSRFRAFGEVAAQQIVRERDGDDVVVFSLGAAYLVTNDLQLDMAASAGITGSSPDQALTFGLSRRW